MEAGDREGEGKGVVAMRAYRRVRDGGGLDCIMRRGDGRGNELMMNMAS